ncbi:Eukaryotic translation initiation factor 3 subunit F [Bulinus truncatus]|nr:Eukaryotic translation initiation factor 3 subunit F [Bulinus truncatus]
MVASVQRELEDSSVPSTPDLSPMPSPMSKEFQHDFPSPPASPGPIRKRSATLDSLGSFSRQELQMARRRDVNHNKTNSPLKTTFLLATNTPQHSDSLTSSTVSSPLDDHTLLASNRRPSSSWRKAIFNRVCTPQHSLEFGDSDSQANSDDGKLHNTVEIRAMWKKAILETLLLIRMEKENHDIRGVADKSVVEITNCFAVPHNESEDEVAVDIEYARNMYDLHKRVNSNETIVGWFSTGSEVSVHSVLIHDYYSREAKNPVHLTVDTFVRGGKMGIKAYHSTPIGVPGKTTGTMFTPVQVETICYDPEQVGVEVLQKGKYNQKRLVQLKSDLRQVETSSHWLKENLHHVTQYVDDVLVGNVSLISMTTATLANDVLRRLHWAMMYTEGYTGQ